MSELKKYIPKVFLCLSILQIFIPFFIFTGLLLQKDSQKFLISQHFEDQNYFKKIVFDEKDFIECRENENEIVWENTFYDIRSVEKKDGKIIVYVIEDENEAALQNASGNGIHTNNGFNIKSLFFSFLFFENIQELTIKKDISTHLYIASRKVRLQSLLLQVFTPPPESFSV